MTRIVIVDDHELVREGIKQIIHSAKDILIVGEAADMAAGIRLVRRRIPDMVVLDLSLPGYDGLDGLMEMLRKFPGTPVLVLSQFPEERFAVRALKAGAAGYMTKSMAARELLKAIRKIMSAGVYISPRSAELLALDFQAPESASPFDCLSNRELQIVSLLGSGKQVKQVAAELSVSISTVNTYRSRIFKKTDMRSNAELIRYAIEHKLID